jgi:uncharacterized protein YciI
MDIQELKQRLTNLTCIGGGLQAASLAELAHGALAHIAELEQQNKALHIKLAGETLRADQGWERYEYANKSHMAALQRVAELEKALNPRQWTDAMDYAWHSNIPDMHKAFEELRNSVAKSSSKEAE